MELCILYQTYTLDRKFVETHAVVRVHRPREMSKWMEGSEWVSTYIPVWYGMPSQEALCFSKSSILNPRCQQTRSCFSIEIRKTENVSSSYLEKKEGSCHPTRCHGIKAISAWSPWKQDLRQRQVYRKFLWQYDTRRIETRKWQGEKKVSITKLATIPWNWLINWKRVSQVSYEICLKSICPKNEKQNHYPLVLIMQGMAKGGPTKN